MPEATRQDLLAAIEDEARRLSRFVGNLLDMTRVEAGALAVHTDWIDVADPIRAAVARARTVHEAVAFTVAAAPGLPLVQAVASLLEQVLFNLLDNAAKYAGSAGPSPSRRRSAATASLSRWPTRVPASPPGNDPRCSRSSGARRTATPLRPGPAWASP
jgi:two-component system sensor histidine kinase KdpD